MKRRDLIKLLNANGKASETIPRHSEIKEQLALSNIRRQGLKQRLGVQ